MPASLTPTVSAGCRSALRRVAQMSAQYSLGGTGHFCKCRGVSGLRVSAKPGGLDVSHSGAIRGGSRAWVAVHDAGRICGRRHNSVTHTVMAEPGCLARVTERWAERGARVERQRHIADNLAGGHRQLPRANWAPEPISSPHARLQTSSRAGARRSEGRVAARSR